MRQPRGEKTNENLSVVRAARGRPVAGRNGRRERRAGRNRQRHSKRPGRRRTAAGCALPVRTSLRKAGPLRPLRAREARAVLPADPQAQAVRLQAEEAQVLIAVPAFEPGIAGRPPTGRLFFAGLTPPAPAPRSTPPARREAPTRAARRRAASGKSQ